MVTEEEISEAVQSLLRDSNPRNRSFTTLNQVVEELQAKLGHDLTHKIDFITAQINLLFGSRQPQQPSQNPHKQLQQQPKDHFAPPQNPNFHSVPVTAGFQLQNLSSSNAVVAAADASRNEAPSALVVEGNQVPKESDRLHGVNSCIVGADLDHMLIRFCKLTDEICVLSSC